MTVIDDRYLLLRDLGYSWMTKDHWRGAIDELVNEEGQVVASVFPPLYDDTQPRLSKSWLITFSDAHIPVETSLVSRDAARDIALARVQTRVLEVMAERSELGQREH